MSENYSKENAKKFAENMFENGTEYSEVLRLIMKKGYTSFETEQIIKPIYQIKLKKVIKKQKIIALLLFVSIIILVGLTLYGESRNQALAESQLAKGNGILHKDGSYTVISYHQNFSFLASAAKACIIPLLYTLYRLFVNYRELKKNKVY